MKTPTKVAFVLCVCSLALYGGWLYLTHFYYRRAPYILGVKNRTPDLLREVVLELSPNGTYGYGALASGQGDDHMDPTAPVPDKIAVSFNEDAGPHHELNLTTSLLKTFRGKITVVINKSNTVYTANLETTNARK
jgi:hypothetical protein